MRILIAFFLIFPAILWAEDRPAQITVVGEGRVFSSPDMATITMGVTHQAKTARDAMSAVNEGVAAMLARLKQAKIEERDVQTRGLNLSPRLDYTSSGETKLRGYVASNTVILRVRDLKILGKLLDDVVTVGANQFQGLAFGLQEPRPAEDEARRAAVKDALAKAELYAKAAGVSLGKIVSISEQNHGGRPQPMMMERSMAADSGVPVAAGEVSVGMNVTMVFTLLQE